MAKTFKSVDQYIAAQPGAARPVLKRVRSIIQKALPSAEEVISYQIPAYKLPGGIALYFAGWKRHYSLYPANDRVVAAFKDELAPYKLRKGTVRFLLSTPVPAKLIERIAKFRSREVAARSKAKAPTLKNRRMNRTKCFSVRGGQTFFLYPEKR